jgi:Reverse transcriptase (RNA-dependent DNA polymerase)
VYDHSYGIGALRGVLRKTDFLSVKGKAVTGVDAYRQDLLSKASAAAESHFHGKNPIKAFHLKKKSAYKIGSLPNDLVVRKLSKNLIEATGRTIRGREFVVENLRLHMEEGVPYRLYRIDVKSFYESFVKQDVIARVCAIPSVSPVSRAHVKTLLDHYASIGGAGIPRGMAISAVLSDLMMSDFDSQIAQMQSVYFYARYVDDIVVLTNGSELPREHLEALKEALPNGLRLNTSKQKVTPRLEKVKRSGVPLPAVCSIEYLGYEISAYEPVRGDETKEHFRVVRVEITDRKLEKIKSRIIRSLRAYVATPDFSLLLDRITFLTSNFRIYDKSTGRQRSAGIHYSYPQLSVDSKSLDELDAYLRNAILSKHGRVFSQSSAVLDSQMKRRLLQKSFKRGHSDKSYVYFSMPRISEIQSCWKYE